MHKDGEHDRQGSTDEASRSFFAMPRRKDTTPRQALIATPLTLGVGLALAQVAQRYFFVSPLYAWGGYVAFSYVWIGLAWCSLDRRVLDKVLRFQGIFDLLLFVVVLLAATTTPLGAPFPTWGVVTLIVGGVALHAPIGYLAAQNIRRWRRGEFDDDLDDDDWDLD